VQSLVLEELRALLRDDVGDPALTDVRFVALVLSVDYRHARVYFALRGASPPESRAAYRALARATAFLRARLAEAVEMKRVPELRFVFDGLASVGEDEGGTRSM
jgi:ribosome-binding factor A